MPFKPIVWSRPARKLREFVLAQGRPPYRVPSNVTRGTEAFALWGPQPGGSITKAEFRTANGKLPASGTVRTPCYGPR